MNTDLIASNLQAAVKSDFFPIERGCKQGDPIAPYLFLLGGQILHYMLEVNIEIKGIIINYFEIKITQFANDTTLVLDGSQSSLKAALNMLEIFGSYSGLKMNTNKTKVIWIGKKKDSKDKLQVSVDLKSGTTHFNLLGIIFTVDLNEIITLNYSKASENSKKTLTFWNKQNLTPFGKIMVMKTFILSKFNHLFMTIPSPDKYFIKQLNSSLLHFCGTINLIKSNGIMSHRTT